MCRAAGLRAAPILPQSLSKVAFRVGGLKRKSEMQQLLLKPAWSRSGLGVCVLRERWLDMTGMGSSM